MAIASAQRKESPMEPPVEVRAGLTPETKKPPEAMMREAEGVVDKTVKLAEDEVKQTLHLVRELDEFAQKNQTEMPSDIKAEEAELEAEAKASFGRFGMAIEKAKRWLFGKKKEIAQPADEPISTGRGRARVIEGRYVSGKHFRDTAPLPPVEKPKLDPTNDAEVDAWFKSDEQVANEYSAETTAMQTAVENGFEPYTQQALDNLEKIGALEEKIDTTIKDSYLIPGSTIESAQYEISKQQQLVEKLNAKNESLPERNETIESGIDAIAGYLEKIVAENDKRLQTVNLIDSLNTEITEQIAMLEGLPKEHAPDKKVTQAIIESLKQRQARLQEAKDRLLNTDQGTIAERYVWSAKNDDIRKFYKPSDIFPRLTAELAATEEEEETRLIKTFSRQPYENSDQFAERMASAVRIGTINKDISMQTLSKILFADNSHVTESEEALRSIIVEAIQKGDIDWADQLAELGSSNDSVDINRNMINLLVERASTPTPTPKNDSLLKTIPIETIQQQATKITPDATTQKMETVDIHTSKTQKLEAISERPTMPLQTVQEKTTEKNSIVSAETTANDDEDDISTELENLFVPEEETTAQKPAPERREASVPPPIPTEKLTATPIQKTERVTEKPPIKAKEQMEMEKYGLSSEEQRFVTELIQLPKNLQTEALAGFYTGKGKLSKELANYFFDKKLDAFTAGNGIDAPQFRVGEKVFVTQKGKRVECTVLGKSTETQTGVRLLQNDTGFELDMPFVLIDRLAKIKTMSPRAQALNTKTEAASAGSIEFDTSDDAALDEPFDSFGDLETERILAKNKADRQTNDLRQEKFQQILKRRAIFEDNTVSLPGVIKTKKAVTLEKKGPPSPPRVRKADKPAISI